LHRKRGKKINRGKELGFGGSNRAYGDAKNRKRKEKDGEKRKRTIRVKSSGGPTTKKKTSERE